MGTATNQIATEADVNNLRYGAFSGNTDSDPRCPTKTEIEGVEFLTVIDGSAPGDKCVKYQYIVNSDSRTFYIYYGIYNNKSSNAMLDYVSVQIRPNSSSSWTTIGTTNPGSVNSTKTGSILCTIPDDISLSTNYLFRVVCGDTAFDQAWYAAWGNSSNITSSTFTWGSYLGSMKWAELNWNSFNGTNEYSVLCNALYPTVGYHTGRSSTRAACFLIS